MNRRYALLVMAVIACLGWIAVFPAHANKTLTMRLKDVARIEGVRNNQLTGLGLVVGLNGTGDTNRALANIEMVVNVLARHGIQVDQNQLKVRNIAAVMLTANLPPFLRSGDTLDVQVASFGDAKSLQGGILLQAPLTGADGKVYAVAQGPLVVGGYAAGGQSQKVKNVPTTAIMPHGAIIEREVPVTMMNNGIIRLILNKPDFTTASRLAKTVNETFGTGTARAADMSLIEIRIPESYQADRFVDFIARLEGLAVTPDGRAKIVISERTGTIVVGDGVRIAPVAITHGSITVEVRNEIEVSQPASFSEGSTEVTQNQNVNIQERKGVMVALEASTTVGEVVQALNAVGSTPQEIIAILVAIDQAGALYGILEVN